MPNLRFLIAYDGTDFTGWQIQAGRRTVQGVLEAAIEDLTGMPPRLLVAGRTDSGVHALGQVASMETRSTIPVENWRAALQARLPDASGNPRYRRLARDEERLHHALGNRRSPEPGGEQIPSP